MRARVAIMYSGETVELREVALKNKPESLLKSSSKGTVPVLVQADNSVIEESFDIMHWALAKSDADNWLSTTEQYKEMFALITLNDDEFKVHLDHYKYANRFPDLPAETYRTQGEEFLAILEKRLSQTDYLFGDKYSLADIAIFPFVRQFAHVDKAWFRETPYVNLQKWLTHFLESKLYSKAMKKYAVWQEGDEVCLFGVNV